VVGKDINCNLNIFPGSLPFVDLRFSLWFSGAKFIELPALGTSIARPRNLEELDSEQARCPRDWLRSIFHFFQVLLDFRSLTSSLITCNILQHFSNLGILLSSRILKSKWYIVLWRCNMLVFGVQSPIGNSFHNAYAV
jgi:hypothetical protein